MTHRVEPALPADESALRALWNACLASTHPLSERALRQNLEGATRTSRVASLVVRDGAHPVGWVLVRAHFVPADAPPAVERLAISGAGKGGLAALCVDPAARRRGIGTALLAAAEARLRAWAVPSAASTLAPFHFVPGVPSESPELDRLLELHGWAHVADCVDLDADVSCYEPLPAAADRRRATPEVDLRPLRPGEEPAFRAFMSREFPGVWEFILCDHLDGGGALDDVMVAVERGQLLAFAQVHDARSRFLAGSTLFGDLRGPEPGGLGPIGVAAPHRKRGLGLTLLDAALQHQRRRGVRRMVIDWTTLEDFYGKAGFRPFRRYRQRRKTF